MQFWKKLPCIPDILQAIIEVYSPNLKGIGHNELIVGKALKDVRDKVVIATKLFLKASEVENGDVYGAIKKHLLGSMERLQVKMVDLYYLHRLSDVPLEEIAKAMGQLIKEGLMARIKVLVVKWNVI